MDTGFAPGDDPNVWAPKVLSQGSEMFQSYVGVTPVPDAALAKVVALIGMFPLITAGVIEL